MSCVKGCCPDYRTHIRGINIGGFPSDTTLIERRWDKDMPAYKRLRNQGYQPKGIDGAYAMEREAVHPKEIEMGRAIDPLTIKLMEDNGM